MKKLTTIAALLKRVRRKPELAACALAALLFLAALPAPARAQNTYGGATVVHDGFIGLVPGQSVSVTVPNSYFLDGSVRFLKHSIKVYEIESSGITENPPSRLIYSGESGGLNESGHEYGHVFTIRYSDLPVRGEPGTGRVELRIEVESFPPSTTQERTEEQTAVVWSPTIELIEDRNGKTVLFGLLLPAIQRAAQSQVGEFFAGNTREVSVGVVEGQKVRLTIDVFDNAAPPSTSSDGIVTGAGAVTHVKVFNASTGALLQSRELTSQTAGVYSIDINRADLREAGEAITGRLQLWILVTINSGSASASGFEESNVWVLRSTFQVIDNESGETTVSGPMKESMETMKKAWKDAS